jgi:hypothetical protein
VRGVAIGQSLTRGLGVSFVDTVIPAVLAIGVSRGHRRAGQAELHARRRQYWRDGVSTTTSGAEDAGTRRTNASMAATSGAYPAVVPTTIRGVPMSIAKGSSLSGHSFLAISSSVARRGDRIAW